MEKSSAVFLRMFRHCCKKKTRRAAGLTLLLPLLLSLPAGQALAGGCTGSNFSYTVDSINYCTNTVCITFSAYATGLHGNETFCWNWGDGTPQVCDAPGLNGNQTYTRSSCKSYNLSGTYQVSLNVTPSHSTCLVQRDLTFMNTNYTWDISCADSINGCINFEPNPNSPGLVYKWSTGATTQDVCNLPPGNYTLTVTDPNGCSITEPFTVQDATPIGITVDNANCGNGTASITVTGGTPPNPSPNPFNENFNTVQDGSTSSGADNRWTSGNPNGGTWDRWQVIGNEWNGYSLDAEAFWQTGCIDVKYCTDNRLSLSFAKKCNDANANDYVRVFYKCNNGPEVQILNPVVNEISNYPTYCNFQANIPNCTGCLQVIVRVRRPHTGGTCNTTSVTTGPCVSSGSTSTTTTTTTTTGGGGGQDQDDNRHEIYMDNISVTCTPSNPPPYTYLWCDGSTSEDITTIPPGSSNCCVTVTDGNGCTGQQCVQCCALALTPASTNVTCYGGSDGTAGVNVTTGTPPITYTWSNSGSSATVTGLAVGSYTVTVSTSDGCQQIQPFTITQPTPIVPNASAVNASGCQGNGSASVTATGGNPAYTYRWSTSPQQTGTTATDLIKGFYYVTVTDQNGCTAVDTAFVDGDTTATFAAFTFSSKITCRGADAQIVNLSGGGSYYWDFGDGTTSTLENPMHTFVYGREYRILLRVTNTQGCSDTASITINPGNLGDLLNPRLSNVFTPNNDGYNDCFIILPGPDLVSCGELIVYNRWGIRIYDNRFGICWDGTTDTGVDAPEGTYYWVYRLEEKLDLHGWVSLLRDSQ